MSLLFSLTEEYNNRGTTNILKPGQGRKAAAITVPVCVYLLFLFETDMTREEKYMKEALKEAKKAAERNEVPIGAFVVMDDKIIGRGYNRRISNKTVIEHAEINAIRKANKKNGDWRLDEAEIYVTLEPCLMCAGAIQQARIRKVYFGAYEPKSGSLKSITNVYAPKGYNHYPEVYEGVLEKECSDLLKSFFKEMRRKSAGRD